MTSFYGEPPGMFSCEPDAREGIHGYRCQCAAYGASCACEVQEDQPSEMQMGLQQQIPWNDLAVAPLPAAPAAPPAKRQRTAAALARPVTVLRY